MFNLLSSVELSSIDSVLFLEALNFTYISWEGPLAEFVHPPNWEEIEYPIEKEEFNLTPDIRLMLPPDLFGEIKPLSLVA